MFETCVVKLDEECGASSRTPLFRRATHRLRHDHQVRNLASRISDLGFECNYADADMVSVGPFSLAASTRVRRSVGALGDHHPYIGADY